MAKNGFLSGLFGRRQAVVKGPDDNITSKLLQDLGYDLVPTSEGGWAPIPRDVDADSSSEFNIQNRWSTVANVGVDLVNSRPTRLTAYKKMDRSGGESATVLDVIADEVVNITDYSESSLLIEIGNKKLKSKVMDILERDGILSNIRSDIRSMVKLGDFSYILTKPNGDTLVNFEADKVEDGTALRTPYNPQDIKINYVPPEDYQLDGASNRTYKMVLDSKNLKNGIQSQEVYPWEYSLFSIPSRDTFPYGLSELEKMRIPWERLSIVEELLAITRASRLDRIAVTVPGIKGDPTSVLARLSQLKNTIRNIVLGTSGNRVSRNQDNGLTEFLWVPEGFDVKKLSSSLEVSTIEDVEYFRDKLINASRLPKGFFIVGEGNGQQRPLSLRQQDIKFARSLIPISESYCVGLKKLIMLIAFYLGEDIGHLKINVSFKKSPYVSDELMRTYQDALNIVQTYREMKSSFSEVDRITDVEVMRILDLIGIPHTLVFPENKQESKSMLSDSTSVAKPLTLMELSRMDVASTVYYRT